MIEKLKKNLITSLLLAAVVFFIISIYADFNSLLESFNKFNWLLLPILLILSISNYLLRFIKWQYYLQLLGIEIPVKKSITIFFSGLSMSASPGKMGEVIKSLLLKEIFNEPISKTASIVFVERLTDFLSLTLLSIIGIYVFKYSAVWVYFLLIFFILIIIFISNKKGAELLFSLSKKSKIIQTHLSKIKNLYESSYILLRPKPLLTMISLSVFSWFFECFAFYLILINFDLQVTVLFASFVYSLSTIAGAVSMLPGGLGVTEGSLSLILISSGISAEYAIATTIIIRVVTLWFAVLLGSAFLFYFQRQNKTN